MVFAVLKLVILVSLCSCVLGVSQRTVADKYGTVYGCPVCPKDQVCAGPADEKKCVMPKSVGKRCGHDPFWICQSGLTCEEGFCKVPKGKDCKPKGSICVDGTVCAGTDVTKKCVVPKRVRKRCGQDVFSVCQKQLVCEEGFCKNPERGDCKTEDSLCVDGTVCVGTDMKKKCVKPISLRRKCGQTPFSVCKKGLVCEEGFCKIPEGRDCAVDNPLCVDDTICVGTDMKKKCVKPISLRRKCGQTPFSVCKKGLVCEEGFCKIPEGRNCAVDNPLCVDDTICVGTDMKKKCVKPISLRRKCGQTPFSVCKKGLVCEEGFCKIPEGRDCAVDNPLCVDDTICVGTDMKKKCVKPISLRRKCGQTPFSVCKKGLVCEEGFCKIPEGRNCAVDNPLCVDDTICVGTDMKKKCVKPISLRRKCGQTPFSVCKKGLVCEEGFCKIPEGRDCAVDNPLCVDDTICVGTDMKKKCVKPISLRRKCGQTPFSVCKKGLVCEEGFCKIPEGRNCAVDNPLCVDGTTCAGTKSVKKCVRPKDVRMRCGKNPFAVCKKDLVCEDGLCKIPRNGDCTAKGSLCIDGTVCIGTNQKRKCLMLGGMNKPCGPGTLCPRGLQCVGGFCRMPKIPVGGSCLKPGSICVDGSICAGTPRKKVCVKPKSIEQKCGRSPFWVCKRGLHCIRGICKKKIPHGGNCLRKGAFCAHGTVCVGTSRVKRCVIPGPAGYRCGKNPFMVCRKGLKCQHGLCRLRKGRRCGFKNAFCEEGTVCSKHKKRCVVWTGCGKRCSSSHGCRRGLTCEKGICKIPVGGQCYSEGSICVRGSVCAGYGLNKRCVMLKKRGQRCGTNPYSMCHHGLKCEQGTCKVAAGGDCKPSHSTCIRGYECAGHRYRKRCVKPKEEGAPCGHHSLWVCKTGLKCVYGRCRKIRVVGLGGDCGGSNCACGRGLICVWKHGRKVCVRRSAH
ncbi:hypothetical protein FGB62_58g042 [Gracilaria domingensis]|nr:hypothetical protein FGB62_58g042 [Gracilaria domingensis]